MDVTVKTAPVLLTISTRFFNMQYYATCLGAGSGRSVWLALNLRTFWFWAKCTDHQSSTYLSLSINGPRSARMYAYCAILQRLGPHGVNYRGKPYHSHCFVCCECETELGDTKFATKDDKPYCQICYVKMFSKTCIACERPISGSLQLNLIGCSQSQSQMVVWENNC